MTQTYININGELRDASTLTVPKNRVFRNAWQFEGVVVEVDMAKAREIHRDNLRQERSPRLGKLDTDWFRAAEISDTSAQAEIAAQKQKLRDITDDPRIDSATTPEELVELTLDALLA